MANFVDKTDATKYAATARFNTHYSVQVDVLMGLGDFGVEGKPGAHYSMVENTCVGCHMERNPNTYLSHGEETARGHRFGFGSADANEMCKSCHSDGYTVEGVQGQVKALHAMTGTAMGTKLAAALAATADTSYDNLLARVYDPADGARSGSAGNLFAKSTISKIEFVMVQLPGSSSASARIKITFDPLQTLPTFTGFTTGRAARQLGVVYTTTSDFKDGRASGTRLQVVKYNSNFAKAYWNWAMVTSDASWGVHNPTFVMDLLRATMYAPLTSL
jgi:hypothetical protein